MSQLIPFESAQLPAYLQTEEQLGNVLVTGGGGGFPVISIRGKVFHLRRGDETTLIAQPDDPDTPLAAIEVVILNGNPGTAKNYYRDKYVEGTDSKPTCYSNDGIAPAADATEPQADKCATCSHNQWGSRITEDGRKALECQDSKRLAVATVDAIGDPMLLRVPATSIRAFNEYLRFLASRGYKQYQAVVTKIGFDHAASYPSLTFKPVGFVDEGTFVKVREMVQSDIVGQIVGTAEVTGQARPAVAAPAPTPKLEEKTKATKPKVEKPVEAAKPAEPVKAAEPVVIDDIDEGLDAALDSVEWDD